MFDQIIISSGVQSPLPSVTNLQVDSVNFPPSVISPASSNRLFLAGAGVQGLDIQGEFVISTVIGVYLDPNAVGSLTSFGWGCKTTEELTESVNFFRHIVTGSFEKFIKVTMKLPLTGQQYSEKVTENCEAIWESLGINSNSDISCGPPPSAKLRFNKITKTFGPSRHYSRGQAVKRFLEIFKPKKFPPGAFILFAISPKGSLTVAFSSDDGIPKRGNTAIENKFLAEAVLESIIGKNGVSPGARLSVAERLAQVMKNEGRAETLILADKKFMKNNEVKEDATKAKTDQEEANDLSLGDKLAEENVG
ncbi:PREDICTED: chalcone--flavonone isomerase-like isoform X1 [Brassica oleracea var. oleracea]|uniref:chalcone--flavonone isomerase-like isoform X1 n=1 Tax=Brassica oleracea var. oleracea TaxID=109376 RepID=UPI0006A6E33E|nr:PREDICTED: chalcone--flavonone isomerase-like isoform X1 [Brassica oleracea var. oleracea]